MDPIVSKHVGAVAAPDFFVGESISTSIAIAKFREQQRDDCFPWKL